MHNSPKHLIPRVTNINSILIKNLFFLYLAFLCSCHQDYKKSPPQKINQPRSFNSQLSPYSKIDFFPIGVWLQPTNYSDAYKAVGINVFVGIWNKFSKDKLQQLKKSKIYVIPTQEQTNQNLWIDTTIIGWISAHEPDNKPPFSFFEWNDPTPPYKVNENYYRIKKADPNRPALLILGRDVGYPDNYYYSGRGSRQKNREDYIEYIKGCDIVSFDCYIHTYQDNNIRGKYWLLANGVQNLYKWSNNQKPVWGFVQTTKIHKGIYEKPPPQIVKAEVWMQIIHGATGIIYFAHGITGPVDRFQENALVSDKVMMSALSKINAQIHRLASVIKSPNLENISVATSENPDVPIAHVMKQDEENFYIFSIAMRPKFTKATFTVKGLKPGAPIEVIDEDRTITAEAGQFSDIFSPMKVHLYKFRKEDVATARPDSSGN